MSTKAGNRTGPEEQSARGKVHRARRPFVFGAKANAGKPKRNHEDRPIGPAARDRHPLPNHGAATAGGEHAGSADLAAMLERLLHLARERGTLTCDHVNDVLPEGVSADELEQLYAALRARGIEIVADAEDEQPKAEEPAPEEDRPAGGSEDSVRLYINQMGRVPLLTREQEREVFRRIEEAELEVKRLVYGLGFAGKEHCAIARKLLAEPPKERFDRIVAENQCASREGHLKNLRRLVTRMEALDAQADALYARCQAAARGQHQRVLGQLRQVEKKLRPPFRSSVTGRSFWRK